MGTPQQIADDTQEPSSEPSSQPQIDYEKRYKDTQAAFTKSQQTLKSYEAKINVLEQLTQPQVELDEATKAELEDLKFSNPDAWRAKLNSLEADARAKHNEQLSKVQAEASQQVELGRRAQVLEEYNRSHPDFQITDDVISYDVPPRITKKLESGEITFEDFLGEVSSYLQAPKKVGTPNKTLGQPDLSEVGGGTEPSDSAVTKSIAENYANIVY